VVDRDPSHAEALLAQLATPRSANGDDRLATILVSLGIAMIAASVVINDPSWVHYGVAAALFPLIIGTALWLRAFVMARTGRRAAGQ
jgi:Flp pilus assembly protein TadB